MPRVRILIVCVAMLFFLQCNSSSRLQYFNDSRLVRQYYTIDIDADTVLNTANGAIISIPKGAFQSDGNKLVKLELVEAFSIKDMITGGLVTQAGLVPLTSGGMFYINPVEPKGVTLKKPVKFSIPTPFLRDSMQLFRGLKKPDGTVEWTNPTPLPMGELTKKLEVGRVLFTENCKSCHNLTRNATGPPLAFLSKRRDWNWMVRFIHNSSKLIASGDAMANGIYQHFAKTQMTAFPTLTEENIRAIFDYVDYKCAGIDPSIIFDLRKCLDSCAVYDEVLQKGLARSDSYGKDNPETLDSNRIAVLDSTRPESDTSTLAAFPANLVAATTNSSVCYEFTIQYFGWYNLDGYFSDGENSELTVRLVGNHKTNVSLYFVLPSDRVMLRGGKIGGQEDKFAFYTDDGKIPLPRGKEAYILAISTEKEALLFGKVKFETAASQALEIKLEETTPERMNSDIETLGIENLNISAKKSSAAIRSPKPGNDRLKFKPVNCDCGRSKSHDY